MGDQTKEVQPTKFISLIDFLRGGYLQELNREYLQPRGFTLQVNVSVEGDQAVFGGIWDYRHVAGGIYYPDGILKPEHEGKMEELYQKNLAKRKAEWGSAIQPIKK